MASIYRDPKSGYWYINYIALDGKRIRRSLGTKDKKLAELKLKEIELELAKGRLGFTTDISLRDFLDKFLEWSKATKSKQSYDTDRKTAENLKEFFGDEIRLSRINKRKAEGFKLFLVNHKGYSKTTANIRLRHTKAMFSKAVQWNYVAENPFQGIDFYRVEEKLKYLTKEELRRFFEVVENKEHRAYFMLIFYTGMRLGEVVSLEWSDVDIANDLIIVRNKSSFHTKNYKERAIPIHPHLKPWLLYLKDHSDKSVRVVSYSRSGIGKLFKIYSEKSGVHCTPHKLRHTFATLLASEGVSLKAIQEMLGHSRITTTEIYAKMAKEYLKESIEKLNVNL